MGVQAVFHVLSPQAGLRSSSVCCCVCIKMPAGGCYELVLYNPRHSLACLLLGSRRSTDVCRWSISGSSCIKWHGTQQICFCISFGVSTPIFSLPISLDACFVQRPDLVNLRSRNERPSGGGDSPVGHGLALQGNHLQVSPMSTSPVSDSSPTRSPLAVPSGRESPSPIPNASDENAHHLAPPDVLTTKPSADAEVIPAISGPVSCAQNSAIRHPTVVISPAPLTALLDAER